MVRPRGQHCASLEGARLSRLVVSIVLVPGTAGPGVSTPKAGFEDVSGGFLLLKIKRTAKIVYQFLIESVSGSFCLIVFGFVWCSVSLWRLGFRKFNNPRF